jgi:hypothetical protein
MLNELIDKFPLPDVAVRSLKEKQYGEDRLDDGVSVMSGHNKGVAYYFDTHQQYNPFKSEQAGYEVFDTIELIYTIRDRQNVIPERVNFLPHELLKFDQDGECVGGKYRESYLAWKAGKKAPGTKLATWGVLSDSHVATLHAQGIFSVEQFAECPRSKFESRYPVEFQEAHDRARQFLASRALREEADKNAQRFGSIESENEKLKAELKALQAQMASLMQTDNGVSEPRRRGRPRKEVEAQAA